MLLTVQCTVQDRAFEGVFDTGIVFVCVLLCCVLCCVLCDQAVFPENTPGSALDALARLPLWSDGLNYRHGTGMVRRGATTAGQAAGGSSCCSCEGLVLELGFGGGRC